MIASKLLLSFITINDVLAMLLGGIIGFYISSFLKRQWIRRKNSQQMP